MSRKMIVYLVVLGLLQATSAVCASARPQEGQAVAVRDAASLAASVATSAGADSATLRGAESSSANPASASATADSSQPATAKADASTADPAPSPAPTNPGGNSERGQVGIGLRISLLGPGAEAAVSLSKHFNARGGFNYFTYNRTFDHDGVTYKGSLDLQSGEAHLDWFPFGHGFHLSPGLVVYNGNKVTGNASVPGNSTFTLGSTTYLSDPTNPIGGNGKIDFRKVSPSAMIGFGNLVPRHRHFSFSTEVGVVFQGQARTKLQYTGNACAPDGTNCVNAATDPNVQANVLVEQTKLNNKMSPYKYYPVLSVGFGYRF